MAAVTRVKGRPTTIVGYEVNDKGRAATDLVAGDLLVITGADANDAPVWSRTPAGATEAHGIALQDYYSDQRGISVGIQGEMAGFSGLTPGQGLYPSNTVPGGLDTTAPVYYTAATTPAVNVPAVPRVRARTATAIRYNFV